LRTHSLVSAPPKGATGDTGKGSARNESPFPRSANFCRGGAVLLPQPQNPDLPSAMHAGNIDKYSRQAGLLATGIPSVPVVGGQCIMDPVAPRMPCNCPKTPDSAQWNLPALSDHVHGMRPVLSRQTPVLKTRGAASAKGRSGPERRLDRCPQTEQPDVGSQHGVWTNS
jgi:hypothetical protein